MHFFEKSNNEVTILKYILKRFILSSAVKTLQLL